MGTELYNKYHMYFDVSSATIGIVNEKWDGPIPYVGFVFFPLFLPGLKVEIEYRGEAGLIVYSQTLRLV